MRHVVQASYDDGLSMERHTVSAGTVAAYTDESLPAWVPFSLKI